MNTPIIYSNAGPFHGPQALPKRQFNLDSLPTRGWVYVGAAYNPHRSGPDCEYCSFESLSNEVLLSHPDVTGTRSFGETCADWLLLGYVDLESEAKDARRRARQVASAKKRRIKEAQSQLTMLVKHPSALYWNWALRWKKRGTDVYVLERGDEDMSLLGKPGDWFLQHNDGGIALSAYDYESALWEAFNQWVLCERERVERSLTALTRDGAA